MALTKADLEQFIAAEKAALAAGLPDKLADMEALWQAGDSASLITLERQAHSLYGSTGTFGFKEVSAACKGLELAVQAFAASGTDADRMGVDVAVEAVRTTLRAQGN